MNALHQSFTYALTGIVARDEEMVDLSVLLDIGVPNRLTINFSNEWINMLNLLKLSTDRNLMQNLPNSF